MSFNEQYKEVQRSYQHMQKVAFEPISFGASLLASELAFNAARKAGVDRAPNFLRAGIELGRKGEKMNPFTETMSRNLLGNKQLAPYEAGLQIGNRINQRGMDEDKANRFLDKALGMAQSRYSNSRSGKSNPILSSINEYNHLGDLKHQTFQKILTAKSVPTEAKGGVGEIAANTIAAPGGLLDFRLAARPLVRLGENNEQVRNISGQIVERTPIDSEKIKRTYNAARNYID